MLFSGDDETIFIQFRLNTYFLFDLSLSPCSLSISVNLWDSFFYTFLRVECSSTRRSSRRTASRTWT